MGEEVRRNYIWSYLVILKVVDVCADSSTWRLMRDETCT
jgi:hypothetical protein